MRRAMQHRLAGTGTALVLMTAYSWWATSTRSFSTAAYAAVALPFAGVAVAYAAAGGFSGSRARVAARYRSDAGEPSLRAILPWLAMLLAAVALESAGLALGGRSATVPTLSDVVDRLLRWHVLRGLLFAVWLTVGVLPVHRLLQRPPQRAD